MSNSINLGSTLFIREMEMIPQISSILQKYVIEMLRNQIDIRKWISHNDFSEFVGH